jgi:acetyl esterase/lipase
MTDKPISRAACLRRIRRRPCTVMVPIILLPVAAGLAGCTTGQQARAPGRVLAMKDPQFQRAYSIYLPSYYRNDRPWPLIIACHGSGTLSSHKREIDATKGLAEHNGFILAAPDLAIEKQAPTDKNAPYRELSESVPAILSILQSLRGAYTIDDSRIFLTGSSTGSLPALLAALRYPDVFRAVSVRQPDFPPEFIDPAVPFLDPYQPIRVVYCPSDLFTGKKAKACIEWLRRHELYVSTVEQRGTLLPDPAPLFGFFEQVVRKVPWIRIQVRDNPADDMEVSFSAKLSVKPTRVRWEFGDGTISEELAPTHKYAKAGRYKVKLAIGSSGEGRHVRQVELQVPRVRLGARTTSPTM